MDNSPRFLSWLSAALLAGGVAFSSMAAADEDVSTFAIQNRQYRLGNEINLSIGVLPLNAFTKGITFGGGYTLHFNDLVGWEIGQFYYSLGLDTDLKNQLLQNFSVQPTQISSVNYFGSSNFVLKPLYGKSAWFNHSVVHTEIFFVIGPAIARYINPNIFAPGFDIGLGLRAYLERHVSLRLDIRDYVFFKAANPSNELHLALSLAFSFGGN